MLSRDPESDMSRREIKRYLLEPHGLAFDDLAGFPVPSYIAPKNQGPRWTALALAPWIHGYARGIADNDPSFHAMLRIESELHPEVSPQEQRERALQRFAQVAVARVLTRRLPP